MTLICTVISRHGIVQAADSNLTSSRAVIRSGPKLFDVNIDGGVLALAGSYRVGRQLVDTWIPEVIKAYRGTTNPTLGGFARFLATRLGDEVTDKQREGGHLIQISGYGQSDGTIHPEMWFVRNIAHIDQATGEYVGRLPDFAVSEDFWQRDYLQKATQMAVARGDYQRYFNGFSPGRIAFNGVTHMLHGLFRQIWEQPGWKFRAPSSLDELASFVKLYMETTCTLFRSSDYDAPYIGGDVQIKTITPPKGAVTL
jgi:hypothetical protein